MIKRGGKKKRPELDLHLVVGLRDYEKLFDWRGGTSPAAGAAWRPKILDRVGEEPLAFLGSDDKGNAYGLPSGRVLKVTYDQGEVEAMHAISKLNFPYFPKVFDAFFVVSEPGINFGMGVVIREHIARTVASVHKLEEVAETLYNAVEGGAQVLEKGKSRCAAMKKIADLLAQKIPRFYGEEQDILEGVVSGIRTLREHNICSIEFTPKNIGLIDGRPVLYDVGLAEVQEQPFPDVV